MSPSHVLEPTYQSLRQLLLENTWPPGTRLETVRLADLLHVSATPVRDSLNRLLGERLVDFVPGMGFHVPRLSEAGFRELLACQLALLRVALAGDIGPEQRAPDPSLSTEPQMCEHEVLLGVAAAFGANRELHAVLSHVSLRLEPARSAERILFSDTSDELSKINVLLSAGDRNGLEARLALYHYRRSEAAARIIARLERG
ncbi:DNA-binding GntR family transcriptional regulator [Novosphingobium hassiacum]|uniref:DNA-binding GntR family transcriptional regulator n=1 Tax=Novosphingobium hassiacum TaxID=173676 RepID=A0A7W6EWI0_9SPHN|nr:GntR family transcriptional regulator [Novosphingobium hassiacum]MBB3860869.1 DNA-binding GntR family transcriptional regulator [Novosphingobium hassiacum]